MGRAARRLCAVPICQELATTHGRCAVHSRQQDVQRGTAQQRGYDSAWAAYSRQFRIDHPVCGERADGSFDAVHSRCVQQGLTTPAECVDHTVPMSDGGDKWDPTNHMSACFACNSWKAQALERRRA